nr:hypothetical protein [Tanacetum cinerariifolium]
MTRVVLPFVQRPPAQYLGNKSLVASRRHVAASYWTAASDVEPTSAPVNDAGPPVNGGEPSVNGGGTPTTVDHHRTTVDRLRTTVDHHRSMVVGRPVRPGQGSGLDWVYMGSGQFTLDYDSQMIDKYIVEYSGIEVKHFRDTLLQYMGNFKKYVAKRTCHQIQYDRRMNKRQMQTQERKQHTKQPKIINEGRVDQYTEPCQVKSPMLDSSPDNQTTDY